MARDQRGGRESGRIDDSYNRDPRRRHDMRRDEAFGIRQGFAGPGTGNVHQWTDSGTYGPSGDIERGHGGGGGRDIFRSDEDSHGGWRVQREGQPRDRQRILDAQRPRHPGMIGGGYGGLQGGGIGRDSSDIRGELQGISYGRAWGGGMADADSAELGAERDRGARGRGRGPKSYRRSDVRISDDVCERLMRDHRIDATDVDVRVENGTVTLSGTVDDRDAKWIAEDVVERVSGVREVENRLKVRRRSASRPEE